jgi:hypothetical protein|tara:strand:+ start:285 stop:584 length:300 start_codon:yes stop_codon:yes gene_type:complete
MANSAFSNGAGLSGEKTVAAAGTAEALGTGLFRAVTVLCKAANTGQVYIGGSDVDSSTNSGLDASASIDVATRGHEIDLAKVYIDVDVSAEGVDFYAMR